jgi:hypothetical protein
MEDLQRSFNQLGHYSGGGGSVGAADASESLYEEVDVLSPVKADSAASSYLSGVGDLMTSCRSSGSGSGRLLIPVAPFSSTSAKDVLVEELVEEEVVDDGALDNTEVEYYEDEDDEDVEIEEIELDDELYEAMVLPESAGSKINSGNQAPRPSSKRSDDANTAATTSALDEDDEDDLLGASTDNQDPPPSREEVAEAITYIVRQEKVVEYGLMTKQQVDEMNDLPLEEMMEIMKHFEICDNNNATIQWDLVLAMINPDYSLEADAEDAANDDDEDEDNQNGPQSPGRSRASSSNKARMTRQAAVAAAVQDEDGDEEDYDEDGGDGLSEIHPLPGLAGSDGDAASAGSYSLEVGADPSETGIVSNLTAADYATDRLDEDGATEYLEETLHGSIVSIDPLIRASYTKSMVELKKSHHSHESGDGK